MPDIGVDNAIWEEKGLCAYQWLDSLWTKSYEPWADVVSCGRGLPLFHYLIFGGDSVIQVVTSVEATVETIAEETTLHIEYKV